jgi:DNA-binding NarL/FixJ family response regulator
LNAPESQGVIRVLLVDDHAMVRQGLKSVLQTFPQLEVVGEACNGEDAIRAVQELTPSVVVMDINMPRLNGIQATTQIKRQYPHIVIVGLSIDAADDNRQAMAAAGATALISKEKAVDQLYREIMASLTRRSSAIH